MCVALEGSLWGYGPIQKISHVYDLINTQSIQACNNSSQGIDITVDARVYSDTHNFYMKVSSRIDFFTGR
ncbi:hypothetical protein GL2_30900 [Microbulbifer sp. GL-2]|nr:hypothetical protein GL2_30900 [Microbulbifer sp. GL-2]